MKNVQNQIISANTQMSVAFSFSCIFCMLCAIEYIVNSFSVFFMLVLFNFLFSNNIKNLRKINYQYKNNITMLLKTNYDKKFHPKIY